MCCLIKAGNPVPRSTRQCQCLSLSFLFGLTRFTAALALVKGTAWSAVRYVQHGFDPEAALKTLEEDLETGSAFAKDTAKLIPAIMQLRQSSDFPAICKSAHALKRVLDHLPADMRAGFNKQFRMEERISSALKGAVSRCGTSLLMHGATDEVVDASTRLKSVYFGLFLIGRSENVLDTTTVGHTLDVLIDLHQKRNNSESVPVISSLQTFKAGRKSKTAMSLLHRDLKKVYEILALGEVGVYGMVPVYIGYALGDQLTLPDTKGFLNYLTAYFKEDTLAA